MADVNNHDLMSILSTGYVIFADTSDSDEELLLELAKNIVKKKIPKVTNYAEITVPSLDDVTFRSHFRMSRASFQFVLQNVAPALMESYSRSDVIDAEKQLLVTIWTLANQESYR